MSRKKVKAPGAIVNLEAFANKLNRTPYSPSEPLLVPLTVMATAVSLLGAPLETHNRAWLHFAESDTVIQEMEAIWTALINATPYLKGNIHPLLSWMSRANEQDIKAVRHCWSTLAEVDLHATLVGPMVGGDILGPMYTLLRSRSAIKATGAIYTPMAISQLIAMMLDVQEGTTINEPCCGSGGMLVATVKAMRENGRNPNTCIWVANDIDPVAVALCGVNLMIHGMDDVVLTCDNILAPRSTGPVGLSVVDEQPDERSA